MELTGKVHKVLEIQTGQSKSGQQWRKQEFVIEVPGSFPTKVCFVLWGDKISQFSLQEGEDVSVSFDLESRENSGKWYTSAKAWKVTKKQASETQAPPLNDSDFPGDIPGGSADSFIPPDDGNDLPF
jgi:hypothetical protein